VHKAKEKIRQLKLSGREGFQGRSPPLRRVWGDLSTRNKQKEKYSPVFLDNTEYYHLLFIYQGK